MSPELWKRLQGRDKTFKHTPQKNDLFALGLVVLQAGTRENVQGVYEPSGNFNQAKLEELLQKFFDKYGGNSQSLCYLTRSLAEIHEADRPDAKELINKFQDYHTTFVQVEGMAEA